MDKLIVNIGPREKRAALIQDGRMEWIEIERAGGQSLVGSIFLGTVTKVLPGMNAVFIDIGLEKNAYLHRDSLAEYLLAEIPKAEKEQKSISTFARQGERLIVQAEKDPAGTKGAKVTGIIELSGKHLVFMPFGKKISVSKKITDSIRRDELRQLGEQARMGTEGILFRTSAGTAPNEEIIQDIERLREEASVVLQKAGLLKKPGPLAEKDSFADKLANIQETMGSGEIISDDLQLLNVLKSRPSREGREYAYRYHSGKENVFEANGLGQEIGRLLKRVVWLENGSYLLFEETETLTAIDVNTGKFSGKTNMADTVLKTNLLAAEEIARQIRLRDLGGIILADFIDMKSEEDRQKVIAKMENELKKDGRRTRIAGFTSLGILQLTRRRLGPSLAETLTVNCPSCEGTGRITSPETEAFRLERELWEYRHASAEAVLIEATPEVKAAFEGEGRFHLKRLEESLGMEILISPVPSHRHFYSIKQFGKTGELKQKEWNGY